MGTRNKLTLAPWWLAAAWLVEQFLTLDFMAFAAPHTAAPYKLTVYFHYAIICLWLVKVAASPSLSCLLLS